MTTLLWTLGGVLLLVTALPLLPVDNRFIRAWDFPRSQIAVLLALTLAASVVVLDIAAWPVLLWCGVLALALGYQIYRIFPYTPAHPVEAIDSGPADRGDADAEVATIRLLVANVRQSNRAVAPLLREIAGSDPDLILLLETDAWWTQQVEPLAAHYPEVVRQPQDDGYGMCLFSRLPLIEPRIRFLLEDYVPSIVTGVRLTSGVVVDFHGVHPKPPPLHDTEKRNAELLLVGREIGRGTRPAIVAGDLNDVAWSDTTRLFQKISGLLDPRVGRGLYSTYNAHWFFLRWPVDHVFFDARFTLSEMRRLSPIGSDHFPLYIALRYRPDAHDHQQPPTAEREDMQRADGMIEDGVEETRPD